jgi:hypothetical protein
MMCAPIMKNARACPLNENAMSHQEHISSFSYRVCIQKGDSIPESTFELRQRAHVLPGTEEKEGAVVRRDEAAVLNILNVRSDRRR